MRLRRAIHCLTFVLGIVGTILSENAYSQSKIASERYSDIPADSLVVISVDIEAIIDGKETNLIPWEVISVLCKEQFGFDPTIIQSIDGTVGLPSPMPEFGVSIRTSKPFDIASLSDEIVGPVESSPKVPELRFRNLKETAMIRVTQMKDQSVLIGTQGTLRRMMSPRLQAGGVLVDLSKKSDMPVRIAVNMAAVREIILNVMNTPSISVPEALIDDLRQVVELVDNALLETSVGAANQGRLSFAAANARETEKLNASLKQLQQHAIDFVESNLYEEMQKSSDASQELKDAIETYSARLKKALNQQVIWNMKGDRLVVESSILANYQTIGVLTGLLLPAVQSAREAARRMSSQNNLKQVQLALLNYESAHRGLPGRAICDDDGTPLLSWRVAILPYLEQDRLYREFNLDEPWDSPHNIQLLDQMPAVFRSPRSSTAERGLTTYLAPYGEETGWPNKPFSLASITDGTSMTLSVLETADEFAVPWTKPDDLNVDDMEGMEWIMRSGSNASYFDGSVRFFPPGLDRQIFEAMISLSGGERIDF